MDYLRNKFSSSEIILASASPRRKEMLEKLGLIFKTIISAQTDESYPDNLSGNEIAKYLALKKAENFGKIEPHQIIITADTIVWIDDKVLGKPSNYSEAFEMLKQLSGNNHFVISGVCIKSLTKTIVFDSVSKVRFSHLKDEEIKYYINKYKPYDKAGAYGIQEWIGMVGIEHIEGSFYNVAGLPVQKLYNELIKF